MHTAATTICRLDSPISSFDEDDIAVLAVGSDTYATIQQDLSCQITPLLHHVFGMRHGRPLVLSQDSQNGATFLCDGTKRLMPFSVSACSDIVYDNVNDTMYSISNDAIYAIQLSGEIERLEHGFNDEFGNYERLIANDRFVVASKYGLTAWDAKTLRLLVTITERTYHSIIFVSKELLCGVDNDGNVDLIELPSGHVREAAKLDGDGWFMPLKMNESIAVLHGGLSDTFGTVVFPKQLPTRLIDRSALLDCAGVPRMNSILYAGRGGDGLVVWNTSTDVIQHRPLPDVDYVSAMLWSERCGRLFVGGGNGEVISVKLFAENGSFNGSDEAE